jgi:dUTP pyrophosphatase
MASILHIKPLTDEVRDLYTDHETFNKGDSGLDLFTPEEIIIKCGETKFIKLGIKCEMHKYGLSGSTSRYDSYYLYARSSISKTPLVLKNSVGIIDAGYRGELMAAVQYIPRVEDIQAIMEGVTPTYTITKGSRLVQICTSDLSPFNYKLTNKLAETERGECGFGSTGI